MKKILSLIIILITLSLLLSLPVYADSSLKISDDCFKSFESVFVDTPAGYADIAIQNGRVYILYERDCTLGGLYFKKIDL